MKIEGPKMANYRMRGADDCGPALISAATGRPYEEVISAWPGGWMSTDRTNLRLPNDTPWDHFAVLEALGVPFRITSHADIVQGHAVSGKTAILIHHSKAPLLAQHWALFDRLEPEGVVLEWGAKTKGPEDTGYRLYTWEKFREAYYGGWLKMFRSQRLFACAYTIGEGQYRLTAWQRFVARILGRYV